MTNIEIKRFTNPEVLAAISVKHLWRFFERFNGQLQGRNLSLPAAHYLAGTPPYYDAWIELLKSPEKLPDSLVEAILAIEELAAPENRPRLQAAVAQAPPELYLDPASLPECLALQLWLMAPYKRLHDAAVPLPHAPPLAHQTRRAVAPSQRVEEGAGVRAAGSGEGPKVRAELPGPSVAEASVAGSEGPTVPHHQPSTPQQSTNPVLTPQFSPNSEPQPLKSELPTPNFESFRRHTGKVGQLPPEVKESINLMLHDGVPYRTIIERLGEAGKGLTRYHLMSWKKGGYQEWLKAKEREYRTRAKQQFAFDILREKDSGKLHEASLQIASSHVGEFLADFDSTVLREKLQADPLNFVRLLNALSKLSESGIKCEAHRVDMAERCEAVRRSKLPPMELGLSEEALHIIETERFNPPPH